MYLGNNLLACPLGNKRFFVDIYASSPSFNMGKSGCLCLLANISWSMQLLWSHHGHLGGGPHCVNASTPGRSVGSNVIAIWGMCPYINLKGAYPLNLLMLKLRVNSVIGTWSTQCHWSGCTEAYIIWMIVWIVLSACQSPWGWKEVVILSLTPRRWWSSVQNLDMNFESQSDTIDFGSPCKQTTCFRNSYASSKALLVVFIGTKCTCEVRWHTITQR